MRLDGDTLVLSRRNVMALLTKLDGHPPNSACTIRGDESAGFMYVKIEEDDVHYGSRGYGPGVMHPDTEKSLREWM